MFRVHQQIGVYTLIRKLGRGGFGEVWLAEKQSKFVTTKVAVKLPLDEQVDHEAIKQEASLWEQASGHPNILPIIDADDYDGQIVIVSEYAPDGSLEEWLKTRGRMSAEKAVEMTIGILNGLEFLHKRNIIHRDLKPANILLQGDTPRLADFGISRALRTTVSSQSTNVSGTFAYMSPEGFDGKRSVQTDIWSVGVCLYQFLTGNLPFPQKEPSAMIAAIMMRGFEPLSQELSKGLSTIVEKSLAKNPEHRYKSALEMRADLLLFSQGHSIAAAGYSHASGAPQGSSDEGIPKVKAFENSTSHDEVETVVRQSTRLGRGEERVNRTSKFVLMGLFLAMAGSAVVYFVTTSRDRAEMQTSTATVVNNSSIAANRESTPTVKSETSVNRAINTTPSPFPTSTATPRIMKVRVRFAPVWINGYGSSLSDPNITAILITSKGRFNGRVNGSGFITLENVPCNEQVTIVLPPTHGWKEYGTVTHKRFLKCDKATANLGELKIGSIYE